MDVKIGGKVMHEGVRATVIDYGTMFIADTYFIEYLDGGQFMVMGEELSPYEEGKAEVIELQTKLAKLTNTLKTIQPIADGLQHALSDLFGAQYVGEGVDEAKDKAIEAGRKLLAELHQSKLIETAAWK